MNNNYPAGVSGNEPQICGSGLEDKCQWCVEIADHEFPASALPDAEFEIYGEQVCVGCAKTRLQECGFNWKEILSYDNRVFLKKLRAFLKKEIS